MTTQPRQIRIPDEDWAKFKDVAQAAGVDRATVIREFIRWYISLPGSKRPARPTGRSRGDGPSETPNGE